MLPGPTTSLGGRILRGTSFDELRLDEPRTAEAAPVAKSNTPTAGFVTVPTKPLPKPSKRPTNPSLENPKKVGLSH